jgi:hypothetical protein
MTHYLRPEQREGRYMRTVCGILIRPHEHTYPPSCPVCMAKLVEDSAEAVRAQARESER